MTEKRASIGARRNPKTESAVLDAAGEILAEEGIAGLTMEAVARRARAGKATLYRWWPTRGALLMAVYQRQKGAGLYPDTGTLEGDIAAFLRGLFTLFRQPSGQIFRHIIAAAQGDDDLRAALETYRQERLAALRVVFDRARARGELAEDVPTEDMALAVTALVWLHLLTDGREDDPEAMARSLVRGWVRPA